MAHEESAELSEPRIGAFDDPASFISSEFPAILIASVFVVSAVRNDEVDASLCESFSQRIGVIGSIRDHTLRFLSRPTFGARDLDLGERGFRKQSFSRRGTFEPNSQRKTATVDQYHPLRALAAFGFADGRAPFLAGAKLPSRNVSSHFSRPLPSSVPSRVRQASSHTSCSSHRLNRRQQVAGEGYWSGKNRHAAPVCKTHRIPSRQARFDAHGRPLLSLRSLATGSSGSINSHCASVNSSNRFLLTQEVHQIDPAQMKYTA
jgi:hypothetical protein